MHIYDNNNIFAKIIRHELDAIKVYEDNDHLVIMDIMPQAKGHSLIIPKTKAQNILDADPQILQKTIILVQLLAKAALKAFNADGISVMQYNKEAGGQTIFHLHFHVIPHYQGEKLKTHSSTIASKEELIQQAQLLGDILRRNKM